MPSRGIVVWRVRRRRTAGGIGVPAKPGGRPREAGNAAAGRVIGIASGSARGGRRSRRLPRKPRRRSARVSAQPTLQKNLRVPVQAVTSYSFPLGVVLISDSVRAYAVRLYGGSCSESCGGDGGAKAVRGVVAGFRRSVRKYVAAHCGPLACGSIVVRSLLHGAAMPQDE